MTETSEFEALLRRSGLEVPEDELPGLREQFERVKGHVERVNEGVADLHGVEPGFLFEAQWRGEG